MNVHAGDLFRSRIAGPGLVILIDPDKTSAGDAAFRACVAETEGAACILVGGTYVAEGVVARVSRAVRRICHLPLILFPGASSPASSLTGDADAFLCPIVYTSQEPRFLTGWHIQAEAVARSCGLSSIPMGYILVGDGPPRTAAATATLSCPVPPSDIAEAVKLSRTSVMMGMSLVYLDAGSGALQIVPGAMIRAVREAITVPLVIGGGVRDARGVEACVDAGADWIVVGNALEGSFDVGLLREMVAATNAPVLRKVRCQT
jgi:phosphoglycerol geranylgeranyltransferase